MELNKLIVSLVVTLGLVGLAVFAANSKVYVDTNYNLHDIENISNVSYSGNLSDGTLTIMSGNIYGALGINSTEFYQDGNLVVDTATVVNQTCNSSDYWDDLNTPADITSVGTLTSLNMSGLLDMNNNSIEEVEKLSSSTSGNISGFYNVSSTYVDGNQTWSHQSYPSACSANFAVTELGNSNVCTDSWVDEDGDTMTGDLNMNDNNVINWIDASGLGEGLVAFYGFENNSGIQAMDTTRNNNDGDIVSATRWGDGKKLVGLVFNGSGNSVTLTTTSSLKASPITVTGWARFRDFTTSPTVFAYRMGSNEGWGIYLDTGGSIHAYAGNGSNAVDYDSNYVVSVDEWVHLGYWYNESYLKLYVNGTQQGTTQTSVTGALDYTGNHKTCIGSMGAAACTSQYFNGTIDEVKIYNRSLSVSEIKADALGFGPSATGHLAKR